MTALRQWITLLWAFDNYGNQTDCHFLSYCSNHTDMMTGWSSHVVALRNVELHRRMLNVRQMMMTPLAGSTMRRYKSAKYVYIMLYTKLSKQTHFCHSLPCVGHYITPQKTTEESLQLVIHKPPFKPMQVTSFQVHGKPRPGWKRVRTLIHNSRLGILRPLLTFLQGWGHTLLEVPIHRGNRVSLVLLLFFFSLADLERHIWLALLLFRLGLGYMHTKEEQSRYKATRTTTRTMARRTRTTVETISFVFMLDEEGLLMQ